MKTLSIDHSFRRTAYSYFEDLKLLSTGSFEVGEMSYENVLKFEEEINNVIDLYKPDLIVTEKPAHMRNVEIARMLTSLHTVCVLASIRRGLPYATINPKVMKKRITGDGNASKEDVCNVLVNKYGYDINMLRNVTYYKKDSSKIKKIDYDESDSVGNALHYLVNIKGIDK